MLRHRTRAFFSVVAPLAAAIPLILATPSTAAAQTSWGVGVTIGRGQPYPGPAVRGSVFVTRGGRAYQFAYNNGYTDGQIKGREDASRRRSYDPWRHRWYRSADHNYDRHYSDRSDYKQAYRDGFSAGYSLGYQDFRGHRRDWRDRDDWR